MPWCLQRLLHYCRVERHCNIKTLSWWDECDSLGNEGKGSVESIVRWAHCLEDNLRSNLRCIESIHGTVWLSRATDSAEKQEHRQLVDRYLESTVRHSQYLREQALRRSWWSPQSLCKANGSLKGVGTPQRPYWTKSIGEWHAWHRYSSQWLWGDAKVGGRLFSFISTCCCCPFRTQVKLVEENHHS